MSRINDLPNGVTEAGLDFSYAVWTANTTIRLCNVPWTSDYRDIVRFDSRAKLDTYLRDQAGPSITLSKMQYAPVGRPVRINVPFNVAYRFNYLSVSNPVQPVPGNDVARSYYYFITDVQYVAPNTTELTIQLDVWQTFCHDVTFGNCYIERGHIGIANERQMVNGGRDYLTIPEGLDLGGEYQIVASHTHTIGATEHKDAAKSFDIVMATTVSLAYSPGDVENPLLNTAEGSSFEGLPNGAELYWFESTSDFLLFMKWVSTRPWVSQGIISITAVPNLPDYNLEFDRMRPGMTDWPEGLWLNRLKGRAYPEMDIPFTHPVSDVNAALPERYKHLKKFCTYPYSLSEVTTYSGTPLVLKPESIATPVLGMRMLLHLAPPCPRIMFYPSYYNAGVGWEDRQGRASNAGGDNAEFLDLATGITDLPTFSLVNNSYIAFMASNRNALAYQHSSADYSQQRALAGADLSYEQAQRAMATTSEQTGNANQLAAQMSAIQGEASGYRAIQGGANALLGGVTGGPAGMVAGVLGAANQAASYAIENNARQQSLAAQQAGAARATATANRLSSFTADTNKAYAEYAARGDYANAIAGINAKVQDARLTQPTTSGQIGGDAFNLAMYRWALHAKTKLIQGAAMAAIGEFWLRYGYAVQRFGRLPSSLQVMKRFTYWKLRETYLSSSTCPELFRQTIRGIFEKGVTVWADPADIGNVDIGDNAPLPGVEL